MKASANCVWSGIATDNMSKQDLRVRASPHVSRANYITRLPPRPCRRDEEKSLKTNPFGRKELARRAFRPRRNLRRLAFSPGDAVFSCGGFQAKLGTLCSPVMSWKRRLRSQSSQNTNSPGDFGLGACRRRGPPCLGASGCSSPNTPP